MKNKIMYYEDIPVGEQGEACGRTFTEGDLVQFATVASDFCAPHMDRHMMLGTPYGERIGHGFFLNSLATGMLSWHAPYIVGRDTNTAYLRSLSSRFPAGVRVGDTLKFHWHIKEKDEDPDLKGFGIITTEFKFINQDDKVSAEGTISSGIRMKDYPAVKPEFKPGKAWDFDEWDVDYDKVYYYEDFKVGMGEKTGGRKVTETDVVNYMCLMGDHDLLYTDQDYAKKSLYGERIVPPMLTTDYVGLSLRDGAYFNIKKPFVPFMGHLGDDITFIAPARIGDVLYTIFKILSGRISSNKPERGILVLGHQIVNQRGEALAETRLATILPVKAAMKELPTETEWILRTVNRK
ncbi:MAG: MaoC/PaaZ C-terminal domain-containing protein [Dehalococcoidia bacterium]